MLRSPKFGSCPRQYQKLHKLVLADHHESYPKQPKMQTSAGKVLASIFWAVQGILFIGYLEKERTINSEYYIALLVHLKEEIAPK